MKLKKLIEILSVMDGDLEVIVDHDENGWHSLTGVNTKEVEGKDSKVEKCINLVSSNES